MKLFHQLQDLEKACLGGSSVCVGVFDGVHRGHQMLLEKIRADAAETGCKSLVITFRQHPLTLLTPPYAPQMLSTSGEKIRLLEKYGVDLCCMIDFDKAFSETTAESFIEEILIRTCRIRSISCGIDFRFGRQGQGDLELLGTYASREGLSILKCDALAESGLPIRSTRIRKTIMEGDLDNARLLLGHAYHFQGKIIGGDRRGQTIGYPTANLDIHPCKLVPREGVYAVHAELLPDALKVGGITDLRGMLNIGTRPTFKNSGPAVEVHLFDFNEQLYGREILVTPVSRIRDEMMFLGLEALIDQLKHDEHLCRDILNMGVTEL
jgi:riboflavin kinase/FMN adenylyltransferase